MRHHCFGSKSINGVKVKFREGLIWCSIIQDYNRQVRTEWIQFPRFSPETQIEVTASNWFNPANEL